MEDMNAMAAAPAPTAEGEVLLERQSPAARRRSLQKEETQRAILEATEALLEESESDDFSIRQLAERCGYTAPTIYNYFVDKDGLIDALIEARFGKLVTEVERIADEAKGGDPLGLVREHTLLFVHFGRENPAFYRLLLGRRQRADERPIPPSVERVRELMEAPMQELALSERLQVSQAAAHQSMWALSHGLTNLLINRPEVDWNPTLVEDAVDAMLRGISRASAAPPENRG